MVVVAGVPEGHTAGEAEQTPQAPPREGTPQNGVQAGEQTPEVTGQAPEQTQQAPGFGERGRMRRRARFLRRTRELAYRDLGGLVFDLHRFGQRNDQLVLAKLAMLRQIDTEVRELERTLGDRRAVTVLREVGIAACPRCAAIHDSDDRFCPRCGLAFDANADRPISTVPVVPQAQTPPPSPTTFSPTLRPSSPTTSSPPPSSAAPSSAPGPSSAPASPVKPPNAPVAAEPEAPAKRAPEDEPTQILRPQAPDK
jgi:hypothetical protein